MSSIQIKTFTSRVAGKAGWVLAALLVSMSVHAAASELLAGEIKPFPKPNVVFPYNVGVVMDDGLPLRVGAVPAPGSGSEGLRRQQTLHSGGAVRRLPVAACHFYALLNRSNWRY